MLSIFIFRFIAAAMITPFAISASDAALRHFAFDYYGFHASFRRHAAGCRRRWLIFAGAAPVSRHFAAMPLMLTP